MYMVGVDRSKMAAIERDAGDEESKLRLTIKTTKRKESVEIAGEATVRQVSGQDRDTLYGSVFLGDETGLLC